MKKIRLISKYFFVIGMTSALAGFANTASAAAFQLFEQNAVNMGDFGAGGAAIAQDASTAWFNPAGLVRIPNQQLVLSGDEVITNTKFSGTDTWTTSNPFLAGFSYTERGNNVQAGGANFVPALNYAAPLSPCAVFGFSVGAPFGLETNYPQTSALRYSATKTELQTIDISPSLGIKLTNKFSVGAGFDAVHTDVVFDSVAGLPIIPGHATLFDTLSKNSGSAWGYGWHAGLLYQFTPCTRIGLAYRSQVRSHLSGKSKFVGPLAGLALPVDAPTHILISDQLKADITLPPTTTLSFYHDINRCWAIDASAIYTQWNVFNDRLLLKNVQAVTLDPETGGFVPVLINPSIPQNFRNTIRFAVGGIYHPVKCFLIRAGVGYERTPTNNTDRNARLPDSNRFATAIGAHYQVAKPLGIDVGWTHLFMQKTSISSSAVTGIQTATAVGDYNNNHADLLGAQLTWDIT